MAPPHINGEAESRPHRRWETYLLVPALDEYHSLRPGGVDKYHFATGPVQDVQVMLIHRVTLNRLLTEQAQNVAETQ